MAKAKWYAESRFWDGDLEARWKAAKKARRPLRVGDEVWFSANAHLGLEAVRFRLSDEQSLDDLMECQWHDRLGAELDTARRIARRQLRLNAEHEILMAALADALSRIDDVTDDQEAE